MSAQILDGKAIAAQVRLDVAKDVQAFAQEFGGDVPGLATMLVGDDPASAIYVANKQKACKEVGMQTFHFPLPASASREEVVDIVTRLNARADISGILLQLPLPEHLDGVELTGMIDPLKDVDGLTAVSAGLLARAPRPSSSGARTSSASRWRSCCSTPTPP
jgi:methylenetetrahydrofolate dehydrogenase (NADP+)/methenyltetrahydrofolate cyclohydrolase